MAAHAKLNNPARFDVMLDELRFTRDLVNEEMSTLIQAGELAYRVDGSKRNSFLGE